MLMSKVFHLLFLFFYLIKEGNCRTDNLQAINFLPARLLNGILKNSTIELQPKRTSTSSKEHSLCLRVKFFSWNNNYIIASKTIMLRFEKLSTHKGTVVMGEFQRRFSWENSMEISPATWNSICLLYSGMSFSASLYINGKEVKYYYKK